MQHATLMDVFNTATQAASPFIQQRTQELKEQNDLQLNLTATRYSTYIQNYIRDNPYNGNYDEYLGKIRNETDKWYANEGMKNTSPYFQKNLNAMQKQTDEAVQRHVLEQQDVWRVQQEGVDHGNTLTEIKNSNLDIRTSLDMMIGEHERYSRLAGLDPAARAQEKAAIYNGLFDKALSIDVGNMTVSQSNARLETNLQELEQAVNEREKAAGGETTLDNWLKNKQEKIAEAKSAARLAIWKRNYLTLDAMDNEYRRIAADAVKTGSYDLMRDAQERWREGSALRELAMESSEFNPEDRPKIANTFPLIAGLSDSGSGSKDSDTVQKTLGNLRNYHLSNIAEGRGTEQEERKAFIQAAGKLAASINKNIDDFERLYPKETNFFGMWADARKLILERDPGYAAALDSLDTYIKGWMGETEVPREKALRQQQGERIGQYLFDTILDTSGPARITPDEAQREVMKLTGILVEGKIAFLRETSDNSTRFISGINSDRDFGKAIYEMAQHPWARFVTQGKAYEFGDPQYRRDIEETAKDKFKTITGIPLANISIGHTKEGLYDETPEINLIVSGRGAKEDGRYRFVSDQDGKYQIERETGKGWEHAGYIVTAQEARNQQLEQTRVEHGEAVRAGERQAEMSGMQKTFEQIKKEADPLRRKALADALQVTVPPDEFWKAGIHPNSGAAIKEIPARDWDRITGKMTPGEKAEQERKWREMGISRVAGR